MTPNEALTLRIQTVEGHLRLIAKGRSRKIDRNVTAMASLECQNLLTSDLYTWRKDLLSAAMSAAENLPLPITLRTDLMPSASGLYLFDEAVSFQGCAKPVGGIGWCPLGSDFNAIWIYMPTAGTTWADIGPLSAYATFVMKNGADILDNLAHSADWRERTNERDFEMRRGTEAVIRFLLSSWLWLQQKVMTVESIKTSHHAIKLAERADVNPSVNVVILRRRDSSCRASGDTLGEREYMCQWLVRGHWRQQFYPSTSEHKPIWIEPYVKGPEDKPLKPPTQTVFSVTR